MNSKDSQIKEVDFPKELYEIAEKRAQSLGLTFEEYLTQLLEKEVSSRTRSGIHKSKGKYFFAKDEEEIRNDYK